MPSVKPTMTGRQYWRSLDELADTPAFRAFVEREFPEGTWEQCGPATRRQFLKVMGASFALAGLTSCRWPEEKIVPYARRPEGRNPGVPVQYATAFELGGVATGLLVTSYDGRPIKIEGNPLHPYSGGAANAIMQASILDLYDPDRSRRIIRRERGRETTQTWDDFVGFARPHFAALRQQGGKGLCVLSEISSSPSLADMRERFLKAFPEAKWYEYEPIHRDNEINGFILAFGRAYRAHYHLDRAKVIVCLDADLLMTHPAALQYARDFAEGRQPDGQDAEINRLYAIESVLSVTGSVADQRYPVRSAEVPTVVRRLLLELANRGLAMPWLSDSLRSRLESVTKGLPPTPFVSQIAEDLLANKGRCIIAAGPRQADDVHAIVHLLAAALGCIGRTTTFTEEPTARGKRATLDDFAILAEDMKAGRVETVVILGGNPVFDGGPDIDFATALGGVRTTIRLGLYDDETSYHSTWHVPRAHFLESWGDARAYDGTVSIIQPLIDPLYEGKTPIELVAAMMDDPTVRGYDIVRRTFRQQFAVDGDVEAAWRKALHDGVIENTRWPPVVPAVRTGVESAWIARDSNGRDPSPASGFEVVFVPGHNTYDGRFANNAWLQELPDPITKLTWDNAALISPADAAGLGARTGDVLRLEREDRAVEIGIVVLPGQAAGSITLSLGYGRRRAGRVGDGVGVDVNALRRSPLVALERTGVLTKTVGASWGYESFFGGVRATRTNRFHEFAVTQDHHTIDKVGLEERQRRVGGPGEVGEVVREATIVHYREHPDFAKHAVHVPELNQLFADPVAYDGHKWAMAIDLNRCTGCSACVVACQAENNIPVVGKDQVIRRRIMHWMRIDRYFKGGPDNPSVIYQPMACVHCENAPCEQVCPVAATVHDSDGLNVMVYNRCVGTRYCSNNCPYKVRRFNYFNLHKDLPETVKMMFNPDVTVRSRGVMEKCTYCLQRIRQAKIRARNEKRELLDGEVVPACAQTCPTGAIVFGDLNDPESRVRGLIADPRSYAVLAELNVRPRTHYLAKLRNPAPGAESRV